MKQDSDGKCTRDWPHAPPHRLGESGTYFVTARTREQIRHFQTPDRLTWVRDHLLELAAHYGWRMEAWAIISNHYHFVAHSPVGATSAESLRKFLKHFHGDITRHINRLDRVEGRRIWQNYRETHLTYEESYLSRLSYTHNNAVHHGLVSVAAQYEWCSAAVFERACTPAWVRTICSFKFDQIAESDGDL
jgi:putative transposase